MKGLPCGVEYRELFNKYCHNTQVISEIKRKKTSNVVWVKPQAKLLIILYWKIL